MTEHETIKPAEMRELLRLTNDLHATHDSIQRKQRWLQGLCGFFRAHNGDCIVRRRPSRQGKFVTISAVEYPAAMAIGAVPPSPSNMEITELLEEQGRIIRSELQLAERSVRAELRLFRSVSAKEMFTAHDREIFALFHAEMSWLYQSDLLTASADAQALPPRARETLMHLLAGRSEKEIASILGLSKNTVHHYAKLIHRHFDVSSRSELLARWVGK